ncbi:hypothetical protein [Collimonas sp.]|uniref:hypothetical protein n=1 Tax=Collimonas sp. TaxID=1963772 RepID=UPI002C8EE912|nr:hypothetical protein [Collimonas sp.]HWW99485.1 hypothetical protein [Collimonas sp.]
MSRSSKCAQKLGKIIVEQALERVQRIKIRTRPACFLRMFQLETANTGYIYRYWVHNFNLPCMIEPQVFDGTYAGYKVLNHFQEATLKQQQPDL